MKNHINLRIVVQHCPTLGVNVSFLTDPEYPIEDCLVIGGEWADATVETAEATLSSSARILDMLTPRVFRAEANCYDPFGVEVSAEEVMEVLHWHDWIQQRECPVFS